MISLSKTLPIQKLTQIIFILTVIFSQTVEVFADELWVTSDEKAGTIKVMRDSEDQPILTQHARADFRPYIHPILAPDGKGILTEYQPDHHKHQTGLFWGFTQLNGRDYFHHPEGDHWKRKSFTIIKNKGPLVSWQTVYDLLGENGSPVLTETQVWEMRATKDQYALDLVWKGTAAEDITIGKYDYGGLFLRMPWRKDIKGRAINSSRMMNNDAEGERDVWMDVGLQVEGRENMAHISILDHPSNKGYPHPWRVDEKLGVGPVRARLGDWSIAKGKTETIRHQILVSTNNFSDKKLTEHWQKFTGKHDLQVLWQLAQNQAKTAESLTPQEALDAMTTQKDFQASLFASEPMITQPIAFCWDDRGRLWIAENRDYESRGHGFSNSGDSRILILEDTDRDGKADKKTVFAEGIAFPAAIAVGFDGLWLGSPPNLLFIPDKDGNDIGEMENAEVRLTGWGIRDRHETLNSFHWGPDGWLYGCQGFATPSKVGKPKGKGRIFSHKDPFPKKIEFEGKPTEINGGVWRYHPIKDRFEVVAHGFSNPWGIDYDAKGNIFITACVIPHMFHVIPGGIYHRQGGKHFNPHVYQDIRTIVDHSHRSAHGGARIYLSDAFPPEHHGRLFMCNLHEHAILSDVLTPKGSGFTASHGDDFVKANDPQWIGFSMELGPDGALYALDWHDGDICGKEVLNKETGRVYRIAPKVSLATNWPDRYDDLAKMSDTVLAELQTSPSSWHARRARLILQNRCTKKPLSDKAAETLRKQFTQSNNSDHRLRAMWTLHLTSSFKIDQLKAALNDHDEYIRGWAIQLLTEDKTLTSELVEKFAQMAEKESSAVVRLKLAASIQRLPTAQRWEIASSLMAHAEDANDHNIPKMIWFGIEPLVAENPARALKLAAQGNIPLVSEFIARRATHADAFSPLVKTLTATSRPEILTAMLRGTRDGLAGRRNLTAPAGWDTLDARLQKLGEDSSAARLAGLARLATEISGQFGVTSASDQLVRTATNTKTPSAQRNAAIRALASQQDTRLIKVLPELLAHPPVRIETIRAIAAYDQKPLGKLLLDQYAKFNAEEKLEAVQTLASRPDYGWLLTGAIKNNSIPRRDVPPYVARQLRRVVGNGFVEVWGLIDTLDEDRATVAKKYHTLLTPQALAKANLAKGKILFQHNCMTCHKLHGEGGIVGPDITGANRANLDYLLDNILNPSGVIQDDYKMVTITTRGGRTLIGNIISENQRQLTLRIVGQEIVLTKSEIQSRETSPVSLMPDGLLKNLTDTEAIDLIGYLQQIEPIK